VTKDKENRCRNIGKPEFTAARKKVKTLLEAGYDRKYIHTKLKKEGLLSMSYSTFCTHFKKFKEEQDTVRSISRQSANSPHSGLSRLKQKMETGASRTSEPFSIDRSRPVEELM